MLKIPEEFNAREVCETQLLKARLYLPVGLQFAILLVFTPSIISGFHFICFGEIAIPCSYELVPRTERKALPLYSCLSGPQSTSGTPLSSTI